MRRVRIASAAVAVPAALVAASWFGLVAVCLAVLLLVLGTAAVRRIGRGVSRPVSIATAAAVAAVLLLLALGGGAIAVIPHVLDRTAAVAGDDPACIQVGSSPGYRAARSRFDLAAPNLRAEGSGGVVSRYHGVLVVERGSDTALFTWSWRRLDWVRFVAGPTPVVRCRPIAGFVGTLPARPPAEDEATAYFRFRGRTFEIPVAYRPSASAYGAPDLSVVAQAPDFGPPAPPCATARDCVVRTVSVYFDPAVVAAWLDAPEAGIRVGDAAAGDRHVVRIHCRGPTVNAGLNCEHVVLRDGRVYRFFTAERDVARWRDLHDRLVARMRAFQTAGPEQ